MDEAEHIFEMSLDMICVAGFDGRFKAVNPAFERTLGYSADELLARQFMDFVHPDDRQATLEAFGDVVEGGEVTQFENRYITKDGAERWLQWSSRAVPDQSVVYAIARDVTESRRITEEQAALRRVATLAARESSPVEILGAVTEEAARVLETEAVGLLRFEPDGTATLVAQSQTPWDPPPLGSRFTLEGENVVASVHRTGQTARMDDWANATGSVAAMAHVLGVRSTVATPIVVEGRLWGTMIAATSQSKPLPADTESRIGEFTELVATAISNAESREALTRLADEQAALRRVATLVAQGASAAAVFDAVAAEMERLLGADGVTLSRYEPDDEVTLVAHRGTGAGLAPAGTRLSLTGDNVASKVRRTRQPARKEDYENAGAHRGAGPGHRRARHRRRADRGRGTALGPDRLPVARRARAAGRHRGADGAVRRAARHGDRERGQPRPADGLASASPDRGGRGTAARGARPPRRRAAAAGPRDRDAEARAGCVRGGRRSGGGLVDEALQHAERANAELRELAHGILPAALTRGGLRAGVDSLVERLDLPVHVDLPAARLPAEIEASAYFIVAEALTNIMKHSQASHAEVTASLENGVLQVDVRDDGIGGADPTVTALSGWRTE